MLLLCDSVAQIQDLRQAPRLGVDLTLVWKRRKHGGGGRPWGCTGRRMGWRTVMKTDDEKRLQAQMSGTLQQRSTEKIQRTDSKALQWRQSAVGHTTEPVHNLSYASAEEYYIPSLSCMVGSSVDDVESLVGIRIGSL